jgi:predicted double-glycine peptidase
MSRYFALYHRMSIITVALFTTVVASVLECWAADSRAVRSLLEIRRENVIVQEWDLSCGAAALATVLRYQYGDPVSERDIAKALIRRREYVENPELIKIRQGFSLLDLKRYVDSRGYRGIGYGKMTFTELVERAPLMVPVNFLGYNHFVVFRGVMEDRVLLADPAWGNLTTLRGNFENAWLDYGEAMGKVGFVVERQNGTLPLDQLSPKASDFVMLR